MEEKENRKGFSIFYAVIGVATLVVAIIGATFAYFSANAEVEGGEGVITGGTNSGLSNALSAEVTRVQFAQKATAGSDDLVPATDISATKDAINAAVQAGCVDDGYTGCHLYQIKATSTQAVDAVDLKLATLSVTTEHKDNWKYIIYKGTSAEDQTVSDDNEASIKGSETFTISEGTEVSLHEGGLKANEPVYYYLLIYVQNTGESQNAGAEDPNDVTGTYTGTVTFAAAGGGQVSATFSA